MFEALTHEQDTGMTLGSPTVGTWHPALAVGALVTPGVLLGHLIQRGRSVAVHAGRKAAGMAHVVADQGAWCSYGAVIVELGEAQSGLPVTTAAEVVPADLEGATALRAETDGTVYLRPEPGAAPFAAVGSHMGSKATVALVEVMKTFTPVRTPMAGEVVRVDVEDGQAVTMGEAILWVRPAASDG